MAAKKNAARRRHVWGEGVVPIEVVDSIGFVSSSKRLFTEEELEEVRDHVSQFRELGAIIPDSGGLQKIRWPSNNNRGKSHGARVVYAYLGDHAPLYLIAAYAKSKKVDLTVAEKKAARKLMATLKREHGAQLRRTRIKVVK